LTPCASSFHGIPIGPAARERYVRLDAQVFGWRFNFHLTLAEPSQ
jgi:hypothetical protein